MFSPRRALPLSERVPLLENLGFHVINERTYRIAPASASEGEHVWLYDMTLERAFGGIIDIAVIEDPIEAAILALSRGLAESDGFNRLALEAGLSWRDVGHDAGARRAICARSASPTG